MLISFSIENYRSIRERLTLSMVRAKGGTQSRLAVDGPLAGGDLSPIAVIFGANASGKSTVLQAMTYVNDIVRTSARSEVGQPLPMEPFLFAADSASRPTSAEVRFTVGKSEYLYTFMLSRGLVAEETLKQIVIGEKRRSWRTLFSRSSDESGKTVIAVSSYLPGPKKSIIAATRPNSLFLSKAAQENFESLIEIYEFFSSGQEVDRTTDSVSLYRSDQAFRPWVVNLLRQADLGVMDVSLRSQLPQGIDDSRIQIRDMWSHPVLSHTADMGVEVPWRLESQGTQRLWDLSGWLFNALKNGDELAVDELLGLHPLIVRGILELFQMQETNPLGAQLIFTSHDTTLLGSWGGLGYMLDRDQIWFTEKDNSGATELIPLTDFSPRKDEDVEKAYLLGRYGATPAVGSLVAGTSGGIGGSEL